MAHDFSHLDEAAMKADSIISSARAVDIVSEVLSALTPSDLSALLAEKCPGWVAVKKRNRDTIRQMAADAILFNGELPQSTEDMWGFFEWFYDTITAPKLGDE